MKLDKISLNEIYAPVDGDLKVFSEVLKKELQSSDPLIANIHSHLLKMSGKFLRPALAILVSKIGPRQNDDILKLAAAIELIHTATLVHDDIIDNSETRRNQPSVFSKWGRDISIVSGDYLYAKAFLLLAALRNVGVNEMFARCAHVICEGEMKQVECRAQYAMAEEDYLHIIYKKTAALFQAACAGGAYFSGCDDAAVMALGEYGHGLGMAFQIVDDCLDLLAETETLGKTAGLDVLKSDVTLPLLYYFQSLSNAEKKDIEWQMQSGGQELFVKIRASVKERGAIDKALSRAESFIEASVAQIALLPDCVYTNSLKNLAYYCLERAR